MKPAVPAALLAACAALLAACGAPASEGVDTSHASQPESAQQAQRTVQAKVGKEGGSWCESVDSDNCSLRFTVTSIKPVATSQCSEHSDVPADSKLYKVGLDAEGKVPFDPPNSHVSPGYILSSDNWYGLGSDGYTTKAKVAIGCGDYTPGPFYDPVDAGEKQRGSIIFALPADAVALQVRTEGGNAWQWDLPD